MITKIIKKEIDSFINTEYKTILEVATTLSNEPEELVSISYESILNGNETPSLRNAIKTERLYLYFFVTMKNQRNNLHRIKKNLKIDYIENDVEMNNEDEEIEEYILINYQNILKCVRILKKEKKITWYQEHMFILFFDPEQMIPIKELTLKEVQSIRNMSYRKLESITDINYVSIYYSIKVVIDQLKIKLT